MTDRLIEPLVDERYWVVDPIDISHLVRDLRVFGFTDRGMAEEEARGNTPDQTVFEVRITRHNLLKTR